MNGSDTIPVDSDVWLYVDLLDQPDLSEFDADYVSQGEAAHVPRLVLRTIFFGLTHGVSTGRKLEASCVDDNRFVLLSGENRPSYMYCA